MELPAHVKDLLGSAPAPAPEPGELEEVEEVEEEVENEASEESDEDVTDDSEEESEEAEVDWRAKYEEEQRAKNGILANLASMRGENRDIRTIVAKMQKDFETLSAPPEREEFPDIEEDPAGHLNAKLDYVLQNIQVQEENTQRQQALETYRKQVQVVAETAATYEQSFRKTHPDYDEAYNRLQDIFYRGFLANGASPKEAQAQVGNLALRFAYDALQRGADPAKEAYEIALQYGHKLKAAPSKKRKEIPAKVKIGTKVPSISNFGKGAPTQSRSKGTVIDADTFWNTWDASERAPYLANQEFFEQIMTQKQAVLPG